MTAPTHEPCGTLPPDLCRPALPRPAIELARFVTRSAQVGVLVAGWVVPVVSLEWYDCACVGFLASIEGDDGERLGLHVEYFELVPFVGPMTPAPWWA